MVRRAVDTGGGGGGDTSDDSASVDSPDPGSSEDSGGTRSSPVGGGPGTSGTRGTSPSPDDGATSSSPVGGGSGTSGTTDTTSSPSGGGTRDTRRGTRQTERRAFERMQRQSAEIQQARNRVDRRDAPRSSPVGGGPGTAGTRDRSPAPDLPEGFEDEARDLQQEVAGESRHIYTDDIAVTATETEDGVELQAEIRDGRRERVERYLAADATPFEAHEIEAVNPDGTIEVTEEGEERVIREEAAEGSGYGAGDLEVVETSGLSQSPAGGQTPEATQREVRVRDEALVREAAEGSEFLTEGQLEVRGSADGRVVRVDDDVSEDARLSEELDYYDADASGPDAVVQTTSTDPQDASSVSFRSLAGDIYSDAESAATRVYNIGRDDGAKAVASAPLAAPAAAGVATPEPVSTAAGAALLGGLAAVEGARRIQRGRETESTPPVQSAGTVTEVDVNRQQFPNEIEPSSATVESELEPGLHQTQVREIEATETPDEEVEVVDETFPDELDVGDDSGSETTSPEQARRDRTVVGDEYPLPGRDMPIDPRQDYVRRDRGDEVLDAAPIATGVLREEEEEGRPEIVITEEDIADPGEVQERRRRDFRRMWEQHQQDRWADERPEEWWTDREPVRTFRDDAEEELLLEEAVEPEVGQGFDTVYGQQVRVVDDVGPIASPDESVGVDVDTPPASDVAQDVGLETATEQAADTAAVQQQSVALEQETWEGMGYEYAYETGHGYGTGGPPARRRAWRVGRDGGGASGSDSSDRAVVTAPDDGLAPGWGAETFTVAQDPGVLDVTPSEGELEDVFAGVRGAQDLPTRQQLEDDGGWLDFGADGDESDGDGWRWF